MTVRYYDFTNFLKDGDRFLGDGEWRIRTHHRRDFAYMPTFNVVTYLTDFILPACTHVLHDCLLAVQRLPAPKKSFTSFCSILSLIPLQSRNKTVYGMFAIPPS